MSINGKWVEVFRAGTHTDSAGNTRTWTIEDLDTIVQKYNPEYHEAPVVIGHPKDNAPAFGWVEALKREGDKLLAKFRQVVPEFAEMVKKGLFKKRSISFYPDLTLRHVGFLGAMPPAVKGLADVAFSEGQGITIEFEEYRVSMIGRILRRLREFLIDKFDLETADRVVNEWEVDELTQEIVQPEEIKAESFSEKEKEEDMGQFEELQKQLEEQKKLLSEFKESLKQKDTQIEELKQQNAELKNQLETTISEKKKAEFEQFCDQLLDEGKLTPAQKTVVLDFMAILDGVGKYEFSEGGEKEVLSAFKEFLNGLPKQVELGEVATKPKAGEGGKGVDISEFGEANVDEESLELHQKAIELSEKEGISYRDAVYKIIHQKAK